MRYIVLCERGHYVETQMKRGLLDVCVLKALEAEDSYGYQIIKDISPYIAISESTLYPILRRLEADHYLTVYSAEHNGRLRKYYRITDAGRQKIKAFLQEWEEVMVIYRYIENETKRVQQ